MLDRLAEHRDVIALDFPGFGESPDVPAGVPDEVDSYVHAITAFCEALDVDRPHVAGNSMGGLVALRLGQLRKVRSVTALSPAGFWTPGQRSRAIAWGTHDRILPPSQATRAKTQLRNATFVTLPACGHVPLNDNPALVAQVILQTGSSS